jgi:O-antigen/teichoic acid export membrane protein
MRWSLSATGVDPPLAGLAIYNDAGLMGLAVAAVLARAVAVAEPDLARSTLAAFDSTSTSRWRDLQRQALPIGMFLVVLNFYSYIDTLMLGVISTFGDTGLYNNAYRIYEGLSYVPGVLSACSRRACPTSGASIGCGTVQWPGAV